MKRLALASLLFAVALGAGAGLLVPRPVQAVVFADLYIQPGGATSTLTCGFHGSPGCPIQGSHLALDWSSTQVIWRSYGVRGPSGGLGTGFPGTVAGVCSRIGVDIYDSGWVWRGKFMATHATLSNGAQIAIAGGSPTAPALTTRTFGTTVSSEPNTSCPFGGRHLHQWNSATGTGNTWYHNTNVYPIGSASGNYDPLNWSFWQARTSWTE